MKLHLDNASGLNRITASTDEYVQVNQTRHLQSLVVLPDRVLEAWPVPRFEVLGREHFQALVELGPEMVLFGSGRRHRFPSPRLYADLIEAGIGVEIMTTAAACRTYNILVAEGRRAAAALIIETA